MEIFNASKTSVSKFEAFANDIYIFPKCRENVFLHENPRDTFERSQLKRF